MSSSKKLFKFVPAVFLLVINIQVVFGATVTDISRLRKDLLVGYDPHSRPVQNHQNATVVRVNFLLKGFELNEKTSILNMYAWTVMVWEDEHMRWDPSNYGNLTRIHFAAHELWQPDLTVYNNVDKSEIDHFGNTRVVVFNSSHVLWVPPTKFQVGCQTNLRKWPYDTQKCTVVVGSWAHDGSMLDIDIPPNMTTMDSSDFKPNREWNLLGTSFIKRVRYFTGVPGVPFPDLVLSISISRKSAAHTACIVVPGLVLFYRDSLLMLAFALVWTISLRYLAATKRNSPVPLPGFITSFLQSLPAKILCLDPRPLTGGRATEGESGGDPSGASEGTGNGNPFGSGVEKNKNPFQEDWAWLAHLLDRVAFVIYLVVYLCFYLALL